MLGLVGYREHGERAAEIRVIRGVRFCAVNILPGTGMRARWSLYCAARTLARADAHRAVVETDDAAREYLAERGVSEVSAAPLYRATAEAIARRYLAQKGIDPAHATVAFAGERVTPELRRAVFLLARDVRYVVLRIPRAEAELARSLRAEMGVAARLAASDEDVRADLTLCFEPCEAARGGLRLYDPALTVEYDDELPTRLLSALWSAGTLDVQTLAVRSVETPEDKSRA